MNLSIIIPAYNCEHYIIECLDSITEEVKTSHSVEVIVINDGSTDKTKEILIEYKKKYKINLINNLNYGASFSRNCGINYAKGDYIMFVDADDKLSSGWFKVVEQTFNNDFDIIYFNSKVKEKEKKEILKYIVGNNKENICIGGPISKLYRKKLLVDNNVFFIEDLINGEDILFNINALSYAKTFTFINYTFYKYRQVEGSTTKKFDSKIINSDILFHEYLSEYLESFRIPTKLKEEILGYCLMNAIVTIYDRIAYLPSYKKAKEYTLMLYDAPYNKQLFNNFKSLSLGNKIKYIMYKIKMKYILFLIYKLIHKVKLKNRQNIFLEI